MEKFSRAYIYFKYVFNTMRTNSQQKLLQEIIYFQYIPIYNKLHKVFDISTLRKGKDIVKKKFTILLHRKLKKTKTMFT